ncbi:enolase-phosphatase E1-like isoform X3 [Clytia hemisphaerica]|uniref:enolase-phosphatase E1-like isoform X3 n=1 Tax=Clytia hemisphaerica TaxID=252671 RepID=UPI0034D6DCBF
MPLSPLISGRPLMKGNRKLKNVFTVKGKCASNNNLAPSKLNMTPLSVASDAESESTTPSKTPNLLNILNDVDWSKSPIRNRTTPSNKSHLRKESPLVEIGNQMSNLTEKEMTCENTDVADEEGTDDLPDPKHTEEFFTTSPVVAKQRTGIKDVTATKDCFEEISMQVENESPSKEKNVSANEPRSATPKKNLTEFISTIGLSKVTQENVQEKAVKRSMETQAGSAKVVKKKRSRLKNNNKEPNILEEGVSNRSMRTRSRSNKTIDISLAAYCSMINKSINQTTDVDQDDAGVEKHPSPISKAKRAKRKRVCMPTKNRKSSSKSSTSKSSNDTTVINKSSNKSTVNNRSKAVKSLQATFDDQQPGTSKATSMSVPCSAVDEVEERPDTEHHEHNQLAYQQVPEQQVLVDAEELEENSESEADRQAREDEECDKGDLFEIERWERPPVKVQIKNRETNDYDNRDDVQYNSCSTFWRSASKNVGDPNNLLISRITGGSGCFTGQIKLRARKRKGEQRPKEELFFFIARGPVWFTCNSSTWRSHTGEHVVIPKGQKYDVENKSNHETRIVYFSPKT